MSIHLSPRAQDLAIRATGFVLCSAGALAIASLCRAVHAGPSHEATYLECSFAALGFIGLSLGSSLIALGAHIFDQVEVSARWPPHYEPDRRQLWTKSDDRFGRMSQADPHEFRAIGRAIDLLVDRDRTDPAFMTIEIDGDHRHLRAPRLSDGRRARDG